MKLIVKKGRTSLLVKVFIQDSSSTTGAGLTGLVFNTSSLVCYRARDDDGNAAATAITLATATRGTWASGGFVEKDATNMPGVYEFGVPDAAIASGSETVIIMLKGATNMAQTPIEIQLVAYDPQDSVRQGMTALPNAAAEAAGGLYTRGTGAGQINQDANGRVDTNVKTWIGGAIPAVNVTGVPKVDLVDWLGVAPSALGSGRVAASVADVQVKKNVALNNFSFRMTDSTDHISPKTGLTVTGQVSIDGAAFGALTNAVSEIASGWYKVNLAAADLNGGVIALKFTATGADQLDSTIITQVE